MERNKVLTSKKLDKKVFLEAQAEKIAMTLNTASDLASGLLIQRLTELYENPIEATVRETISNAIDAVSTACSGTPTVEVISPTTLSPVLVIKDNGVGMTYDDLKDIYSKYGSSTKTDDLETIGAYGLGAKSPLAYGTEFTVTSVKDGQKTTIIVAREEMTNYIKIVDSVETEEHSGTIVSIPVKSKDIDEFEKYINLYKSVPDDKGVDLIINTEKVVNDLVVINDQLKIYENESETVYGRVWINTHKIIDLLKINDKSLPMYTRCVIGRWAYTTPKERNYRGYYRDDNLIYIELKPGIVGFNSSRDAILGNERYDEFEKLIMDYMTSSKFSDDIIKVINASDINLFKSVVNNLIVNYRNNIKLENGKFNIENINFNGHRDVDMSKLVHNETGYSINTLLDNAPKTKKGIFAFREERIGYVKKIERQILADKPVSSYSGNEFENTKISNLNFQIDNTFLHHHHNLSVERLALSLSAEIAEAYNNEVRNQMSSFTIITDIDEDNISKLKPLRNGIVQLMNSSADNKFSAYIVYTEYSKAEMELLLENITLENTNLQIETADKMIEDVLAYRAANKVTVDKVKKEGLSTSFSRMVDNKKTYFEDIANIENNEKTKFLIIGKESSSNTHYVKMMNWFCNENDLGREDVDMYISNGFHTLADLETLSETFEDNIFRDPKAGTLGTSKVYMEEYHNRVAGLNAIINNEVKSNKAVIMLRILTGVAGQDLAILGKNYQNMIAFLSEIAGIANIEFKTKEYYAQMQALKSFDLSVFGEINYYNWGLSSEELTQLGEFLSEGELLFIQDLLALDGRRGLNISVDKDGQLTLRGEYIDRMPEYSTDVVKNAFEDGINSQSFKNLVKTVTNETLKHAIKVLDHFLLLDFKK